jgi:hypothetical protein
VKKLIALVLAVVMVLGFSGAASADPSDPIDDLVASGKMSNEYVDQVYVDLSLVSQGSVTGSVYAGVYELRTDRDFLNVLPQSASTAKDKLVGSLTLFGNNNPDHIIRIQDNTPDETVVGYVYGARRAEIITAFLDGIPECLGPERSQRSRSRHTISPDATLVPEPEPEPEPEWAKKYLVQVTFKIDDSEYTLSSSSNGKTETKKMNVAPEVKNDQVFLPVRFVAESLGAHVFWDPFTKGVTITKGMTALGLTIGSNLMFINGETKELDVVPYIKNSRTMLPAHWVADPLGAIVEWDSENQQTTISLPKPED